MSDLSHKDPSNFEVIESSVFLKKIEEVFSKENFKKITLKVRNNITFVVLGGVMLLVVPSVAMWMKYSKSKDKQEKAKITNVISINREYINNIILSKGLIYQQEEEDNNISLEFSGNKNLITSSNITITHTPFPEDFYNNGFDSVEVENIYTLNNCNVELDVRYGVITDTTLNLGTERIPVIEGVPYRFHLQVTNLEEKEGEFCYVLGGEQFSIILKPNEKKLVALEIPFDRDTTFLFAGIEEPLNIEFDPLPMDLSFEPGDENNWSIVIQNDKDTSYFILNNNIPYDAVYRGSGARNGVYEVENGVEMPYDPDPKNFKLVGGDDGEYVIRYTVIQKEVKKVIEQSIINIDDSTYINIDTYILSFFKHYFETEYGTQTEEEMKENLQNVLPLLEGTGLETLTTLYSGLEVENIDQGAVIDTIAPGCIEVITDSALIAPVVFLDINGTFIKAEKTDHGSFIINGDEDMLVGVTKYTILVFGSQLVLSSDGTLKMKKQAYLFHQIIDENMGNVGEIVIGSN